MTDPPASMQTRRILAVRVGRGGDLVMVTPALRLLLDAFPGAEIDLWTGPDGPRVLRGFGLSRMLVEPRRFPGSWLARRRLAAATRHAYDRAYVFETDPRRANHQAAPEVHVLPPASSREHFADRCLDLVEHSLPAPLPRPWAQLPVDDAARAKAKAYLAQHGIDDTQLLVGLHVTFSGSAQGMFARSRDLKHRVWPAAQAAAFARELARERPEVRCVVDAVPDEIKLLGPFLERAGNAVTLLTGPPDFERYKAVLQRMTVLVTPNTGPMHFAAAVGTNVVALFSGWAPSECGPFVPVDRAWIVQAEDMPGGTQEGLAAIPAEEIFSVVEQFLP
jgi:ADP-heptose:LPS heptosyltransferase